MKETLEHHLDQLTKIRPFRNYWNLDGLKIAANYIENDFKKSGLLTSRQNWDARGNTYENIIAKYNPEKKQRLIVGAHYDVFGNQSGADDNTSGVAGLLVLANKIATEKPELSYGIDFVSYCLEEPPFFGTKDMGSYQHAESLFNAKTPVVGMICLDMIGYFSQAPNSQNYPTPELSKTFPTIGNFIAIIGHTRHANFSKKILVGMEKEDRINIKSLDFSSNKGLAGLSDHRNYWLFGYPAVMINDTASYRNPNYHKKSDLANTLDYQMMEYVVRGILHTLSSPIDLKPIITENHPLKDAQKKQEIENKSLMYRIINFFKSLFN